jgi:hypothetical protein
MKCDQVDLGPNDENPCKDIACTFSCTTDLDHVALEAKSIVVQ